MAGNRQRGAGYAIAAALLVVGAGAAGAGDEGGRFVDVWLEGSLNPAGLRASVEERGTGGAGASSWEGGAGFGVSPAYAQGALRGVWTPAPAFVLQGRCDLYGFFGTSGSLLSFSSADEAFGSAELKDRKGDERASWGQRLQVQPTLRARLGPVVVRNQSEVSYYRFHGDGPYFYEQEYDTLLRDGDALFANRTQVLFDFAGPAGAKALYAGAFYEFVHARASGLTRQRWGALSYWEAGRTALFGGRPRAYLQLGVNSQDRNREGEVFAALGVGATFSP